MLFLVRGWLVRFDLERRAYLLRLLPWLPTQPNRPSPRVWSQRPGESGPCIRSCLAHAENL